MRFYYSFLAGSILLGSLGQIALKHAANQSENFLNQCLNPLTIFGLIIYALAAVAYMVALRKIPVSVAFPSVSASYMLVAFAAFLLWNEPFGFKQVAAIGIIGAGIYLLNFS